jgi:hypothetical protein
MTKQERHRQKMKDEGLERMELTVHPDDKPKIKNYAGKLSRRRQREAKT